MATLFALCAICTHWIITGYSVACEQATNLQLAADARNSRSRDCSDKSTNNSDSAKSK